jgi:AAA family ATP:ADP antiporter
VTPSPNTAGIRRDAWIAGGLAGAAGALLLTGYDAARTTASAALEAAYGDAGEGWLLSLMPLGVLAVLYVAGRALSRFGPRRTFRLTALASVAALLACQGGLLLGLRPAAIGFAFVREIYVVLMIEQLWSFLDSTFSAHEAKTLNGPVTGIGSLGAIAGALALGPLSSLLGARAMPFVSAGAVLAAMALADRAYARVGEPRPDDDASDALGARPLLRSRTLLLLLGIVLVTRVLSATVTLGFEGAVQAGDPAAQKATLNGVYGGLNGLIAAMQFIAAPLLLRNLPVAAVWIGLPLVQLGAAFALLFAPSVGTAAASLVVFRAFEYSLFRDTKELFYLPRSFAVRYRSKLLLDALGHRLGKGLLALALGAPTLANARLVSLSAPLSVAAAAVWLALAVGMAWRRAERIAVV